jgi:carbonic anhydrase
VAPAPRNGYARGVTSPALPPAAAAALARLREGNRRFAANVRSLEALQGRERLAALLRGQQPFAVVLGCSDSRAPAEIVFDQGLGDLFVIRVAGNVVAPSGIGSVEFAVARFGTPLVVVMGHTRCGAVEATVEALRQGTAESRHVVSILERVRPAVAPLLGTDVGRDPDRLLGEAVRANVRVAVDHLRHGSDVIEATVAAGQLAVVGGIFELETGQVDFFEGVPGP